MGKENGQIFFMAQIFNQKYSKLMNNWAKKNVWVKT